MRSWAMAFVLLASVGASAGARAQESSADGLDDDYRRALEHAKRDEYREACPLFAKSQRADPQPRTLARLADCEEHVKDLVSALAHWREAIERLSSAGGDASSDIAKAIAVAKKRADELDPRVPRLTVRLAPNMPPGARVLRAGVELSSAALGTPMMVNPGTIELVVIAPGRREGRSTVTLVEGKPTEITVAPGAEVAAEVLSTPAAPGTMMTPPRFDTLAAPDPSWGRRHRASLIVLGSAGALAAAGVGLGIWTWQHYDHLAATCPGPCSESDLASLHRESVATNTLLTAAGVTAITSVVVFVVESRSKPKFVAVAVDGAGGRVTLRF